MSKHGDLTSRIWRTVVFSGAMLGAPLAMAEEPRPAPQKKLPPPSPLDLATRDRDEAVKRVDDAVAAIANAKTDAERATAKAKLEAARRDRATAEAKIAGINNPKGVPAQPSPPAIAKLEKQLGENYDKLEAAIGAVAKAPTDADRKKAFEQVATLRKERETLVAKIATERAKLVKRPRSDDSDRPTGRGFILS